MESNTIAADVPRARLEELWCRWIPTRTIRGATSGCPAMRSRRSWPPPNRRTPTEYRSYSGITTITSAGEVLGGWPSYMVGAVTPCSHQSPVESRESVTADYHDIAEGAPINEQHFTPITIKRFRQNRRY